METQESKSPCFSPESYFFNRICSQWTGEQAAKRELQAPPKSATCGTAIFNLMHQPPEGRFATRLAQVEAELDMARTELEDFKFPAKVFGPDEI
jgi:hypothetical protein